jgi:hypothetical protein
MLDAAVAARKARGYVARDTRPIRSFRHPVLVYGNKRTVVTEWLVNPVKYSRDGERYRYATLPSGRLWRITRIVC